MRLASKVALITGGAGGFGAAQARLFAAEGAVVVIADLREETGPLLATNIESEGGRAIYIRLDVTDWNSWAAAIDKTILSFGIPTVLVQNAGIYLHDSIAETTPVQWESVMDVNAKGVFLGTKTVVPHMIRAGEGSIVNISSTSGIVGSRISAAYNPSKAAVRVFTKSTALQYADCNIRANSIHPGPADTEMLASVYPSNDVLASRAKEIPMGRFGTAMDVAYAALFLTSDESSYMTGAELVVDGGLTAQ